MQCLNILEHTTYLMTITWLSHDFQEGCGLGAAGELEGSGEEDSQSDLDFSAGKKETFVVDVREWWWMAMASFTQTYTLSHTHAHIPQVEDQVLKEEDLLEIIVDRPLPDGLSVCLSVCHQPLCLSSVCLSVVCLSVCYQPVCLFCHLCLSLTLRYPLSDCLQVSILATCVPCRVYH